MPVSRLEHLAHDGTAVVGTPQGVVHVAGAVPGDEVRWTEVGRRGRRVEGRLDAILGPSPHRRDPPCPHDAACGGCDLSALVPDARQRALTDAVGFTLRGLTGADALGPIGMVHGPEQGHRARVAARVQDGRLGFQAAASHAFAPVDRCLVAHPAIQRDWPAVHDLVRAHPHPGLVRVELRTDGERVVRHWQTRGPVPAVVRAALSVGDAALDGATVSGDATLRIPVAGLRLRAGPTAFFQVNLEVADQLARWVRDQALAVQPERVLDLYSGIGTLSLPLAAAGVPVVAVERDGPALADQRASADDLGLTVSTLALDARRFDPSREPYDVAVLDPPRAGAHDVLGRVLRNRPRRVVYVSCHTPALARDLRKHAQGYALTAVRAFDLFPPTHHVEVVAVLDRI